jgi:hypothetical protein
MEESEFDKAIVDFLGNFTSCEINECSQVLSIDMLVEMFICSTGIFIEAEQLHPVLRQMEFKSELIDNKMLFPVL